MTIQKIKLQMVKEASAIYTSEKITTAMDIVKLINAHEEYELTPTEKIILIGLNTKNQVNIYTEIASGASGYANFKINNLFKPLLLSNSDKFILVHNHPSGDATPSQEDIKITKQAEDASKLMGIVLLDHIIISDTNYTSIITYKKEVK